MFMRRLTGEIGKKMVSGGWKSRVEGEIDGLWWRIRWGGLGEKNPAEVGAAVWFEIGLGFRVFLCFF